MQKMIATGILTRDPELTITESGTSMCKFPLAVNSVWKSDGEVHTTFFNTVMWGRLAEHVAKYCFKGSKIMVVGTISINYYDDAEGVRRSSTSLVASEVEFLRPSESEKKENPLKAFDIENDDIPF